MSKKEKTEEFKPIKWEFKEFIVHERGRGWYIGAIIIGGGIIIHSLLTGNWLFALIVVMIGIVMLINQRQGPRDIKFEINHNGIKLGESKTYQFREIKNFWIIYQPPEVKNLYFEMKSPFQPRLTIPLEKENPIHIRAFLRQYLEEDLEQETEPFSDSFGRIIKI